MHPLVSIVMCTYNGDHFLREQIASILAQTYPSFEIIVSDDNSTDGTRAILENYRSDARFKIFFQEKNLGTVQNFSFATQQAAGEYIAFSDQDDIWLPGKIELLLKAIKDKDLVYSDSSLVDEKGVLLQKNLSQLRNMYSGDDTRGFVFSNIVWGHAMMINRKLLPFVLPIPQFIPHDIWFGARAASITGITYVDESLTLYRQHSKTVTTTVAQKAVRRSGEKRWDDFEQKLNWIHILKEHARADEKEFYEELYSLFSKKAGGRFVWPLFFFMLKNQTALFRFTNKSYLSRLTEIRKLSRGESR